LSAYFIKNPIIGFGGYENGYILPFILSKISRSTTVMEAETGPMTWTPST